MTHEEIAELMKYKAPTQDKLSKFAAVRDAATALVIAIDENCPPSPDRTAAVRQVQDSLMTANRSIANDGAAYR